MKSMLKSLMSVAVAALAFTSCSNDATEDVMPNVGSQTLKVNATIDQTRTVMADDHVKLDWATDDLIHFYIGESATEAEAHHIDPVTGGEITGVTYEDGKTVVYAYYSTGSDKSQGVQKVRLNIPSTQNQTKANVFAGEYMPMAASGTIQNSTVTLAFKPLACVLVFNVYGPAQNEKIESIKFETSVGCCGYDNNGCNLTVNPVQYKPYTTKSATVKLIEEHAAIGAAKPGNTTVGENQVYLVVAPVAYPAGSKFIVTTDAGSYTFTTTTPLDCSQSTARVVNLNLEKSPDYKKEIVVPTVPEQESTVTDNNLKIEGFKFVHFTAEELKGLDVSVYDDQELNNKLGTDAWLSVNNTAELTTSGILYCNITTNENAEARTAYIGIKCGDVQEAIAVKQVGAGSEPVKVLKASLTLADITAAVGSYNGSYKDTTITAADGSVWTGFVAGKPEYLQLGWNTNTEKSAAKSYLLIPNAGKVIKKITFTPEGTTTNGRVLALLPEDFEYTGQTVTEVKKAAYAYTDNTVKGSTEPLSIDLTDKNLTRFMIRAVSGAVFLTNITIEYAE